MLGKREIAAIERRAAAARLTIGELCSMAEPPVAESTWSRARARGKVRVSTIRRLEATLVRVEAQEFA